MGVGWCALLCLAFLPISQASSDLRNRNKSHHNDHGYYDSKLSKVRALNRFPPNPLSSGHVEEGILSGQSTPISSSDMYRLSLAGMKERLKATKYQKFKRNQPWVTEERIDASSSSLEKATAHAKQPQHVLSGKHNPMYLTGSAIVMGTLMTSTVLEDVLDFVETQYPAGKLDRKEGVLELGDKKVAFNVMFRSDKDRDDLFKSLPSQLSETSGAGTTALEDIVVVRDLLFDTHISHAVSAGLIHHTLLNMQAEGSDGPLSLPINNELDEPIGGQGTTICVIDTGVMEDHNYFKAADGTSRVTTLKAPRYIDPATETIENECPHPSVCRLYHHGTHVAGIAAGGSREGGNVFRGARGLAPDAEILSFGLDYYATELPDPRGEGTVVRGRLRSWEISKAITTCANMPGIDVINLSVGSDRCNTGDTDVYEEAIKTAIAKDIVIVTSAGNTAQTSDDVTFPACVDDVISVGATLGYAYNKNTNPLHGQLDTILPFSRYATGLDVLAPGYNIVSAGIGDADEMVMNTGTSMASPAVAGLVLLLRQSTANTLSVAELRGVIEGTCKGTRGPSLGSRGIIQVGAAIARGAQLFDAKLEEEIAGLMDELVDEEEEEDAVHVEVHSAPKVISGDNERASLEESLSLRGVPSPKRNKIKRRHHR